MKIITPQQMNQADNFTINEIGVSGIVLMESAALTVVDEIVRDSETVNGKNIFIFAGKGNNGGDAFAVARHLYNKGAEIKLYCACEKNNITGDAKINLDILENMGVKTIELLKESQLTTLKKDVSKADLIIDGIFGTGLKGTINGLVIGIIEIINNAEKRIIAIDIPSGVCGETGRVLGTAIRADKTVTFQLPKIGLVVHPGCEYTGELIVKDIGIPKKVIERLGIKASLTDADYISKIIPGRYEDSNKGSFGKVLIISGSVGMTGAGCLCASSSLRTGAGIVFLGVPAILTSIYEAALRESVTIPFEDNGTGYFTRQSIDKILSKLKQMDVVAVGPGLSLNDDIVEVVRRIIENTEIPIILDADALNAVAKDVTILKKLKCEAVITPHPGEMSRLTGISILDVQNNRIEVAREFAVKWGVITLLKGARTVIALPDGTIFINPTGNSGMATGGSGDVLTGLIAGLIGQGVKPSEATIAGAYLHGLAGDNVAKIKGKHGLIASDLVEELPFAIKKIIHG